MVDPFKVGRCSRCGCFAKREDLTTPNFQWGWKSSHKPGPRGGNRCRAIIRKRVWRRRLTMQRKRGDRELAEILGIPFG